jgi:hypothetical protein
MAGSRGQKKGTKESREVLRARYRQKLQEKAANRRRAAKESNSVKVHTTAEDAIGVGADRPVHVTKKNDISPSDLQRIQSSLPPKKFMGEFDGEAYQLIVYIPSMIDQLMSRFLAWALVNIHGDQSEEGVEAARGLNLMDFMPRSAMRFLPRIYKTLEEAQKYREMLSTFYKHSVNVRIVRCHAWEVVPGYTRNIASLGDEDHQKFIKKTQERAQFDADRMNARLNALTEAVKKRRGTDGTVSQAELVLEMRRMRDLEAKRPGRLQVQRDEHVIEDDGEGHRVIDTSDKVRQLNAEVVQDTADENDLRCLDPQVATELVDKYADAPDTVTDRKARLRRANEAARAFEEHLRAQKEKMTPDDAVAVEDRITGGTFQDTVMKYQKLARLKQLEYMVKNYTPDEFMEWVNRLKQKVQKKRELIAAIEEQKRQDELRAAEMEKAREEARIKHAPLPVGDINATETNTNTNPVALSPDDLNTLVALMSEANGPATASSNTEESPPLPDANLLRSQMQELQSQLRETERQDAPPGKRAWMDL